MVDPLSPEMRADFDCDGAITAATLNARHPEMTYGGVMSFLRRRYTKNLAGADVVVSSVPFDSATSNRPGTRLGPRAIREASTTLSDLLAFPFGFDLFEHLSIIDYGDCLLDHGYPHLIVETLQAHASRIIGSGAKMLTLGGDHFITYPILRAHAEKYGPVALIQFDAHLDTWGDDGTRIDHGSMFARAATEGIIDAKHSVQVGIRSVNDRTYGMTILNAPWVHDNGTRATIEEIRRVVGKRNAYVTFDIDCLDPSAAPGTGTPVAGGLTSAQALAILRGLGDLNLIGMDVVEVSPPFDHSGITAVAAATLAHDFLCLLAMKNGAVPCSARNE